LLESGHSPLIYGALAVLAGLLAIAGWTDVKQRRIPNWVSAAALVLGLATVGFASGWGALGWAGLHVAAALVVGIALTAAGVLGAGDAKLYAALAAWLPIQLGLWLLVAVAIAGLALLMVFAMTRRGRIKRKSDVESDFDKLPYGVAIAVGGLVAVMMA
jgi:prepilin peptidase CpaA